MLRRLFPLLLLAACTKNAPGPTPSAPGPVPPVAVDTPAVVAPETTPPVPGPYDGYRTFRIRAGQNFCDSNAYLPQTVQSVRFRVVFDSSCIYQSVLPENQADINKLYGFADSGTFHQQNSARFGWNWQGGAIHLHAYCYVHGERQYQELGTVPLNAPQTCELVVLPGKYVFALNGTRDTVARGSEEATARGYTLYPYFGGDEPAPQDVLIRIRML